MPEVEIKICGLSTPETVDAAVAAGATHVGLVHYAPSPRHVTLEQASALRARVPARMKVVLLLVNEQPEQTVRAIQAVRPDVVQFHGGETPEWLAAVKQHARLEVWKAVGVKDAESLDRVQRFKGAVDRLLYDAPANKLPGGNGLALDWSVLAGFAHTIPWGLAGGLTPENVADAIRQTGAPLVDTSSGVESAPGVKDVERIAAFCRAARA
ncbi:MAG: phosphoribosylanthranilate isomerase [Altererythrobacter sp.]|nr:phosphoribosylanthranilate isomerase [Altererythrobacter sp.]OJU58671.1 MAG: N-(5'-phosphoribosyl)anthranilate isomerase [Altererythrobacter sp. 66-12]